MDKFNITLLWAMFVLLLLIIFSFTVHQVFCFLTNLDKQSLAVILLLIYLLIFVVIYHLEG